MKIEVRNIYSEVYSLLQIFGQNYIDRLPHEIYYIIKENRNEKYNPQFNQSIDINEQNISRQTKAFIAFFKLYYWSNSKEEQKNWAKLFSENEKKYQKQLNEKYNIDSIFKNRRLKNSEQIDIRKNELEQEKIDIKKRKISEEYLMIVEKNNIFTKVILFIRNIIEILKKHF